MFIKFNRRLQNEKGFTLIELLVVILIIGILAAIALPAFLGQRQKGQDAEAKSNARNTVSQLESCYVDGQTYVGCTLAGTGLTQGTGPGEVELTLGSDSYTAAAHSRSAGTFNIIKASGGSVSRTCSGGSCSGGTW